ncbi:Mitochondrial carrier protein [Hondaea fermentalgiana]|uniref:Mitochondrial carrier protein n=1 Tax=Hondaea fermentalgiana TaxID=2315210 RepID=A0A2R5G6A9_9STRA|nr:Mitochondrial carrier protein [Hondaea fermentalgiana]|eukprot:GBG26592.1 Mitochondrial carrier protein [Hondaea fermentalgiana]
MFAGVVAGAVEAAVTMPMEVTKTRQQYGRNEPMLASMRQAVAASGGIRGLYSGLGVQMLQNAGKIGIRFAVYQNIRGKLSDDPEQDKFLSGFAAGATEALLWVTPCERLKILRIRHAQLPPSQLFGTIFRTEGISSLWVGASPTFVRVTGSNAFRFYVYESIVQKYCGGNAALGGAAVGILSTILNNPVDVLKSEMQASSGKRNFSQTMSFLGSVVREKGLAHIFIAGLPARLVKIGAGQAVIFQVVQWISDDNAKK